MSQIEAYLDRYLPGSAEREYYGVLLPILVALDPPILEIFGYACIELFYDTEIHLKNGHVIGDYSGVMGGYEDIADAIAMFFSSINDETSWWKVGRSIEGGKRETLDKVRELTLQLQQLDMVDYIISRSFPDLAS